MNAAIGINFGDNDFGNTFLPLVEFLASLKCDLTKTGITNFVNNCAFIFYEAHQMPPGSTRISSKSTRDYLKIEESDVYLGDEVENFIKTNADRLDYGFFYAYPDQKAIAV